MKITVTAFIMTLMLVSTMTVAFNVRQVRASGTTYIRANSSMNPSTAYVAASSSSPGYYETSEYLIGSVAFAVIPLESNGAIDPQTENWNDGGTSEIGTVRGEINQALNWWSGLNLNASVSFRGHPRPDFVWRVHQPVSISYEPINRPSTDEGLWISEAMTFLGFPGTDYFNQTCAYANWLRDNYGPDWGSEANWAFIIFMVDSSNDADGCFADWAFAYAYLGGPFIVMTYTNNGWGADDLDRTAAHEIGHIFYATDEWDNSVENSGYLNVADVEGSGGIMDNPPGGPGWFLSSGTWGQVGWRDSDGDSIQDIVDTFPDTLVSPYSPDPTANSTLTYTGTATEIPYPNNNPQTPPWRRRDITINTITNVEFRVDGGPWMNATSDDGAFNESEESFSFTTPPLSPSTHTIEIRGTNSVGNVETTYAIDTVTIEGHDVAVTSLTPSKTVVGQDNILDINATVANQGTYPETFNVTVYANTIVIETQTLNNMLNGTSAVLTFTWSTFGFAEGNYTISASIAPVLGETDLSDNLKSGWILVTIAGDVDGDRDVDIFDIVHMATIYGVVEPDPAYDPNCDIDDDGDIDIFDIVAAATHYGESW